MKPCWWSVIVPSRLAEVMVSFQLERDKVFDLIWWIKWVERDEIVGRIVQDRAGHCQILPVGPHWSPMKSFAAFSFADPESALAEVELYFGER
jgi:hypothetical protein